MIQYVIGDATRPVGTGPKIIAHIVNNEGKWGSGFVLALSRWDKGPERAYKDWFARGDTYPYAVPEGFTQRIFKLGEVQLVSYIGPGIWVANMVAQRGVRHSPNAERAVQYGALGDCLSLVAAEAVKRNASVHMPRIGCGLGGGTWDEIEPIIQNTLTVRGLSVTVYDLEG